jgi:serine/threonine protein kinase
MNLDAPRPDVQPTTDAQLLAGRYQLLDKLGEGGMGAVFRARDLRLERAVAIKMLPAGSAPDAAAVVRFRREAKALAKLSHPGIIPAHDSGEEGGRPFLVMELVEGRPLSDVLRQEGRLSPARAADFAYQAALALHHAHQSGLVHRDVKPSNLLLGADGRVRLLDLGLARFLQDQIGEAALTRTGTGMGTPDYSPPEQFRDARTADVRSDIYALGCTLHHLIAGSVPFPGSSFLEKVEAHEAKEPTPLEELCPEVPAGLALAVRKMMAKRPADRFATMAEVAEALMPHVAGSSASFPHIRQTATWDGCRLATQPTMRPRRRIGLRAAAAALAVLLVAGTVVAIGFAVGWFHPAETPIAQREDSSKATAKTPPTPVVTGKSSRPGTLPKKEGPKKEQPHDPSVLTVAQKPGAAQYQTIGDALAAVKAGQTIRVLDDAVYHETLTFRGPTRHAGVTLEAPGRAILKRETSGPPLLSFIGVPRVTVRGLRLRTSKTQRVTLIGIHGNCTGLRLDSLELSSDGEPTNNGIELLGSDAVVERDAIVIQGCTFRQLGLAVCFLGNGADTVTNAALRDGLFVDCHIGARISGRAVRTQVVGNRFSGLLLAAIQFQAISPDSENILIANNSFADCAAAFRLWDSEVKGKGVRLQNNLLLAGQSPDIYFLEADKPDVAKGPGDGTVLAKAYDIGHNWREGRPPTGANAKGWVPPDPMKGDVFQEKIAGVNRDPKSPDFLRPDPKLKLATAGAGNEDPSLPRYVGALPPDGTDPWDWDRAWRMPKDAQLLTVSKDTDDAGVKYHTINDALKDARPWATIRVLDAATYTETISLTDRKKYQGLTLEAVGGAKLRLAGAIRRLVTITDVPHVRLTGFQLTESTGLFDPNRAFVTVSGNVPGVVLTRLNLTPKVMLLGFVLQNPTATADEPLRIENCTIRPSCPLSNDGIAVSGVLDKDPARGICLRGNRIFNCVRGINLHGSLCDIHVVGNLVVNCRSCSIQLEDLSPASHGLLVANNTMFGGGGGFRVWDNFPYEEPVAGQVEVANNLSFAASHCDMGYIFDPGQGKDQGPGDGKALVKLWRFHHNRRDFSGANPSVAVPPSAEDARLASDDLLSQDAKELDHIRPIESSPLATAGAGGELPTYIGALPPEGSPAWDWDRTWRARVAISHR